MVSDLTVSPATIAESGRKDLFSGACACVKQVENSPARTKKIKAYVNKFLKTNMGFAEQKGIIILFLKPQR
jgi:hypothetical protein